MTTDKSEMFLYFWRLFGKGHTQPTPEYRFKDGRKWRFDWAWPAERVAVEVEGNAWHVRGGGRHMQDSDLEKYNTAAALGWRVFRFSPGMLEREPVSCVGLIIEALTNPQ